MTESLTPNRDAMVAMIDAMVEPEDAFQAEQVRAIKMVAVGIYGILADMEDRGAGKTGEDVDKAAWLATLGVANALVGTARTRAQTDDPMRVLPHLNRYLAWLREHAVKVLVKDRKEMAGEQCLKREVIDVSRKET